MRSDHASALHGARRRMRTRQYAKGNAMIGRTIGGALMGVEGYCVRIEIQIGFGMANFYTVGLAEGAVRESKVRVRSAFMESDLYFPQTCVTLNLAPADVRKDGSSYDLPIAIAILQANGEFRPAVQD